jgi:hypothetical protein
MRVHRATSAATTGGRARDAAPGGTQPIGKEDVVHGHHA